MGKILPNLLGVSLERYGIEKERAKQRMILAHVSSVQLNRAELGTARDVAAFYALNKLGISHGKVTQIISKFKTEEINIRVGNLPAHKGRVISLEIANAIGLSDGRVRQIVNKFKTENINTAKSAGVLPYGRDCLFLR